MIASFLSGGKKKDSFEDKGRDAGKKGKKKGVPGDVGEYVDYEEVDDD
ncbi:MAG: hypothetical protein U9N72_01040 [Bacteroidota bacterium]|nr:hypothetical protein [Bacteroidota bacterium]